ncbi:hypothetical protein CJ184_006345 [Actinotignum urinale]|uniref:Uncharacterized protein n=1 Tax=Actinotignum urinale TaxID=190146 RepID=A0AAW9HK35_9ACTO|nr:hypothetical protein [Actinotignum urinale]MDY5132238.1 hypothetical protein [Actinotignum urinale]MDY5154280.1 hypothetical protein [Actinotignum urinale]WIK58862.1 hypothetical protein CJ184_006345 [Actinotignum urinale]
MMLAYLVGEYEAELESDFWATYGKSWEDFPISKAAILAQPLLNRPEKELCRALDQQWFWRDPLYQLLASALGVKPEKTGKHVRDTNRQATDIETLKRKLAQPRLAEEVR